MSDKSNYCEAVYICKANNTEEELCQFYEEDKQYSGCKWQGTGHRFQFSSCMYANAQEDYNENSEESINKWYEIELKKVNK